MLQRAGGQLLGRPDEGALARAVSHISGVRYQHSESPLSELATIRAYVARMQIEVDMADLMQADAVAAVVEQREDAMLRVLECKAATGECASEVLSLIMRVCGGAAFRKDLGLER